MSVHSVLVLAVLICSALADPLVIEDCGSRGVGDVINLKSISLKPNEIPIPGKITLSGEVQINRDLTGSQLDFDVKIRRHVAFGIYVTVPCVNDRVGSCTYDVCPLLNTIKKCPRVMNENNIPCSCDTITPGRYSLSSVEISIPELSGLWSWLATGDYKVDVKLIDRAANNNNVGCLKVEASVVDPDSCSGFLCSITG